MAQRVKNLPAMQETQIFAELLPDCSLIRTPEPALKEPTVTLMLWKHDSGHSKQVREELRQEVQGSEHAK